MGMGETVFLATTIWSEPRLCPCRATPYPLLTNQGDVYSSRSALPEQAGTGSGISGKLHEVYQNSSVLSFPLYLSQMVCLIGP